MSPPAPKSPRSFTRRALLVGGGGVLAAGALGGGFLFAPFPRARGTQFLQATEVAVALALYEVLFNEPAAPTAAQVGFLERFDASVGCLHPQSRTAFKLGLRALELATLPSFGSRFSALDLARRTAAVRGWERGSYLWGSAMVGFRMQVALGFFESDQGRAACGWALGCVPTGAEG